MDWLTTISRAVFIGAGVAFVSSVAGFFFSILTGVDAVAAVRWTLLGVGAAMVAGSGVLFSGIGRVNSINGAASGRGSVGGHGGAGGHGSEGNGAQNVEEDRRLAANSGVAVAPTLTVAGLTVLAIWFMFR